ncbi:hypothetical protein [Paracoccus seriniphilus]|uniref:hypothetical protein n=1 Tax=Paracoccus seriniphilus TaxID=184748 RepID=UPI003562AB5C
MKPSALFPAFAGLALMAACTETAPPQPLRCSEQFHQQLVGKNIGEVTLPDALRRRIIIPGAIPGPVEDPARLNIHVDDKGWIIDTGCG